MKFRRLFGFLSLNISLMRLWLIPLLFIIYPLGFRLTDIFSAILFAILGFADFLYGFISKNTKSVTEMGKLLDHITDKILISLGFLLLIYSKSAPLWIISVLLAIEIAIYGIKIFLDKKDIGVSIKLFNKLRSFFQYLGIISLMLNSFVFLPWRSIGIMSLYLSLIFSIYVFYVYFMEINNFFKKNGVL